MIDRAPNTTPEQEQQPPQQALLDACLRGDRDAFRDLFLRYQHRVYSIALHYTGDSAAAMDIAQDVFVKLYSSLAGFRRESSFETWLFRLTANCCHDRHRQRRRLVPLDEQENLPNPANHGQRQAERDDLAQHVQRSVAQLPEELRMTVVLRYTEGLSYEEIAEVLGCPSGTVGSRLSRAHRELASRLSHLKGV